MKIAITGASGFLGQKVINELGSSDFEIVAIVRNRFNKLPDHPRMKVFQCDLSNLDHPTFTDIGKPDVLIHLAWDGLPNYFSHRHFDTELPIQYGFLRKLIRTGLRNVVVSGTCLEYGKVSGSLHEGLTPEPHTPYAFAKNALRNQLYFLKNEHEFTLSWTRLFYIYGIGQRSTSLYSMLQSAATSGEKKFAMSLGEQLRDYLSAEVVAKYIVDLSLICADLGVVNICSGTPISVRRLVENWISENKWKIELDLGKFPYLEYEPMAFWGDNRKLKAVLQM